jgi:hypothetical protein
MIACLAIGQAPEAAAEQDFVHSFVRAHCVRCHGDKKSEGELALHNLPIDPKSASDLDTWKKVFEKLESSEMPPEDEKQPPLAARLQTMEWIRQTLSAANAPVDESKARASSRGNWVDHTALFSNKQYGDSATAGRVWRITDEAYQAFIQRLGTEARISTKGISPPWRLPSQSSFPDYSTAHRVGEAEIEIHMRTSLQLAKPIVERLSYNKRLRTPLTPIVENGDAATPEQVQVAVDAVFEFVLVRKPDAAERERYAKFLVQSLKTSGGKQGLEQLLVVVLSHPSVLYRVEKPAGGVPRGMPTPHELAKSIAFALTDRQPDELLAAAAAEGKLINREEVREQVSRILADNSIAKPRVVRFFREFFGYDPAPEVFKDEVTQKANGISNWEPTYFVTDADRLIGWILENDKNVLRELLTTNKTFLLTYDLRKPTKSASYLNRRFGSKPPETSMLEHKSQYTLAIYEIKLSTRGEWSTERPYEMPSEHRMGILTHPAWLVAHSGNFDNHAIHRGRWIRERLLGGRIPDVPITVNAMLPDEPHKTLRERMGVVREEYCWTCHRHMDPLGLPFEQFDHFGRFRTSELVLDAEATTDKRNLEKDGKPKRQLYKQVPFDSSGNVEGSLDPKLNGPVKDSFELIRKLADSELVEQVFVRHAFRFFMGRNETLSDGPTLVAAHQAYKNNNGSMRALLTSTLTSDAFLERTQRSTVDGASNTDKNSAASGTLK